MANIAIFRINYKSDFILTLNSDAGWLTPFCIKFWTGAPSQAYFVGYDGTTYTHCAPVEGEPTKLLVQFDDHHLPIGDLKFQIGYHFTVADFPTSVEDEVLNQTSVIIEVDDAPAQVMLDLNGDTAPEIEFSLPAYANEAQRIENEQQRIAAEAIRIANEESRLAAETIRQQNEDQRISNEESRVAEFARLKQESETATADANAAATLANAKAQLAADKAALADAAATLANAKAQLAADKAALAQAAATLANEKAALAQQKAAYAQTQGDYAKAQGDYAKAQGDTAQADHVRAEADHTRAESDHTQATSDHTQAGTDHSTAVNDHTQSVTDHTQADTDHTRAESDHTQAASDHTQAGADHTRAESDHTTASADHTQAGQDHTRAESDHTRAESDHAAVEVYVDSLGAFDISAYHATGGVLAKYADLTAALGTNGANIPDDLRKGGMSVKFVQSSDNKYVQYRYMLPYGGNTTAENNKFVNAKNWQGVDNEPIAWSANLLESGGVKINYPLFSGVLYDYYLNSSTWTHVVGSISLYVNVKKGDVVKLNKNSDRNVSAAFIQSVDTSSAPVFKNGTNTAISVSAERTIDVVEDCILIVIAIYPGNPVQNFLPGIFEINGIGLYDQSSVIHHLNNNDREDIDKNTDDITALEEDVQSLQNDVIIHTTNKISGGYFNSDGSWTTSSSNTNCNILSLLPGDTVHIKAGHDRGSRIAFVSGTIEVGTRLTFANDTNSAIGITSDAEKDFNIIEPCSIIWIGILYINASNIQDWNPALVQINGKNYEDATINLQVEKNTSEIYELLQDVSEIEQDVSEIGDEASNGTEALNISLNSNIAKYYQKGDSPKSFSSSKKICIITAGQSNAEGRVPYVDMPTAIKEAQPISNCLYVSKSETGAFSPINITGEWAFDLVTYYNIALQQELYVIKWASGGTSIDALGASQYHWTADYEKLDSLSSSLLWKFENEIRNHVESDGNNFDIRAMLWHQGEGDRGSLGTGANERYYVNLRNMIAYIRGVVGNERLPFITGTVSHNSDEYDEVVEAAQYKIASEDPYYRLIDMSGASLINENNHYYHFDAESSIYFGQMCFDALIDFGVITGTKINPTAPWL